MAAVPRTHERGARTHRYEGDVRGAHAQSGAQRAPRARHRRDEVPPRAAAATEAGAHRVVVDGATAATAAARISPGTPGKTGEKVRGMNGTGQRRHRHRHRHRHRQRQRPTGMPLCAKRRAIPWGVTAACAEVAPQQRMACQSVVGRVKVVDTEKRLHEALRTLTRGVRFHDLAVDGEADVMNRTGRGMGTLQLVADPRSGAFVVLLNAVQRDLEQRSARAVAVWDATPNTATLSLRGLLESPDVHKLFVDVRGDADVLWNSHRIRMPHASVTDLQVTDVLVRMLQRPYDRPPAHCQGGTGILHTAGAVAPGREGDAFAWLQRFGKGLFSSVLHATRMWHTTHRAPDPELPAIMAYYAAADVVRLQAVFRAHTRMLRTVRQVHVLMRWVRACTSRRLALAECPTPPPRPLPEHARTMTRQEHMMHTLMCDPHLRYLVTPHLRCAAPEVGQDVLVAMATDRSSVASFSTVGSGSSVCSASSCGSSASGVSMSSSSWSVASEGRARRRPLRTDSGSVCEGTDDAASVVSSASAPGAYPGQLVPMCSRRHQRAYTPQHNRRHAHPFHRMYHRRADAPRSEASRRRRRRRRRRRAWPPRSASTAVDTDIDTDRSVRVSDAQSATGVHDAATVASSSSLLDEITRSQQSDMRAQMGLHAVPMFRSGMGK